MVNLPKFFKGRGAANGNANTMGSANDNTGSMGYSNGHNTGMNANSGAHAGTKSALPLPLWFVRIAQLLLALIILGLSAADAHDWSSAGCNVPGKVGFNIAAAVLTMLAMVYLILSTGRLSILPHIIYAQLIIDFVLLILWIAAAATSRYTCNDLCSNCFPDLECSCFVDYTKRDIGFSYTRDHGFSLTPRAPRRSHGGSHSSGSSSSSTHGRGNARLAFNIIELLTFLATTAFTIYFVFLAFKHKRGTKTAGATGATGFGGSQAPYQQQQPQYQQSPMGNQGYNDGQGYNNGQMPMQNQTTGKSDIPYQHTGASQHTGNSYPSPMQTNPTGGSYAPTMQTNPTGGSYGAPPMQNNQTNYEIPQHNQHTMPGMNHHEGQHMS